MIASHKTEYNTDYVHACTDKCDYAELARQMKKLFGAAAVGFCPSNISPARPANHTCKPLADFQRVHCPTEHLVVRIALYPLITIAGQAASSNSLLDLFPIEINKFNFPGFHITSRPAAPKLIPKGPPSCPALLE
jgi:hypothetical protein